MCYVTFYSNLRHDVLVVAIIGTVVKIRLLKFTEKTTHQADHNIHNVRKCIQQTIYIQDISGIESSGDPVYNSPLILSVTVTLNWYCCPPCSPDTTPEETVSGNMTASLTPPTVV